MSDSKNKTKPAEASATDEARRAALRRLGRFAAVTPPAVALLLAANTRPTNALIPSTDLADDVHP